MQNPYNEGLTCAGVAGTTPSDCPYSSSLMATERQQWLRGFAAHGIHRATRTTDDGDRLGSRAD
ncbi:Rmf/CrpP family protein [Sphingomonas sp. BK235]|jgi:ribosome modulation factor|uniref:Rmf/CrpP family protein n=1 Tax=Sphingomonas sp. BK235 TaxID=2512131 RepID=UPI00104A59D4|nr:Rmf/CrpP family protein [Sphingomonas sp. BK235]TCP37173.1 hypothetical protein EV292_101681 [Sphingomonas sp. BK235]